MRKFLLILILIFVVGFVIQQSQFIDKRLVPIPGLQTPKEEYFLNWDNLKSYLDDILDQAKALPQKIQRKFQKR